MGIQVDNGKSFPAGWSTPAKPCDSCKSAAALLFCRFDSAFLCIECDLKIHMANGVASSKHGRVWMCEVCEQAPSSVTCKADAAALCITCDRDIHTANPLAHRHERIPAVAFYDTAIIKSSASTAGDSEEQSNKKDQTTVVVIEEEVEVVPDSWIDLSNSCAKLFPEAPEMMKSIDYLFSDSDQLLDLEYPISLNNTRFQHHNHNHNHNNNLGTDSVVPIQTFKPTPPPNQITDHNHFEIDFTQSKLMPYKSLTHSVSSSSMDVGIVPDGSSMSEMSYPFAKYSNSGIDLSDSGNTTVSQASQLTGVDREARVLRYREKRKNRKFEKTIRYASRKAYAETRPRIKGRFAKRIEIDSEVDHHLFTSGSSTFVPNSRYGVVPSF